MSCLFVFEVKCQIQEMRGNDNKKKEAFKLGEKKKMHAGIWVIEEREKERETEVPGTKAVLYHLNDF